MRRLALLVILSGCSLYFGDDMNRAAPQSDPLVQEFDRDVYPVLAQNCAGCHVGGAVSLFGPGETADAFYDSIVADPELNGGWIPNRSGLLTKGIHDGPSLTAAQAAVIAQWLMDEGKARGVSP